MASMARLEAELLFRFFRNIHFGFDEQGDDEDLSTDAGGPFIPLSMVSNFEVGNTVVTAHVWIQRGSHLSCNYQQALDEVMADMKTLVYHLRCSRRKTRRRKFVAMGWAGWETILFFSVLVVGKIHHHKRLERFCSKAANTLARRADLRRMRVNRDIIHRFTF